MILKILVKYINNPKLWKKTEDDVRNALVDAGLKFTESVGDAAFYGPKIDVQVWSAIGKEFSLATNQVDFAVPERFNLTYKDADGHSKTPLCIHRAPLGTHERFIGFLIEHFGGNFPLWLAPRQVTILPVSDKFNDYAHSVCESLKSHGIRVDLDSRSEKIGSKIRDAEMQKVNIMVIVGEKEVDDSEPHKRGFREVLLAMKEHLDRLLGRLEEQQSVVVELLDTVFVNTAVELGRR